MPRSPDAVVPEQGAPASAGTSISGRIDSPHAPHHHSVAAPVVDLASDDTWAESTCAYVLSPPTSDVPFPTHAARPGSIQCAFIRNDAGTWYQFYDYGNPHSGDEQIAVRAPYWSDATSDCTYYQGWIQQQNAGN
jgi:hypothetical protein